MDDRNDPAAWLCTRLGLVVSGQTAREALGDALIESPGPWPDDVLDQVDRIYRSERRAPTPVRQAASAGWAVGSTDIVICRGDITRLGGLDAIVNPANGAGLGCFRPSHRCLDNVIHRAAGPRLRVECAERMIDVVELGPTPIVTGGYHLPAPHVMHVAGPIVDGTPTTEHERHLADCYTNCLDVAAARGFRALAFPCISTGLYGYPQREAAGVAVASVHAWLRAHPGVIATVVFDVFNDVDERIYAALAPVTVCGSRAVHIDRYHEWS